MKFTGRLLIPYPSSLIPVLPLVFGVELGEGEPWVWRRAGIRLLLGAKLLDAAVQSAQAAHHQERQERDCDQAGRDKQKPQKEEHARLQARLSAIHNNWYDFPF